MADSKISGLSAITALTSTDELVVASSGASKKITAANLAASLPGYEIGYDQITSNVNITGTTAAGATTIITCAAHTFDGAAVLLTVYSPQLAVSTTSGAFVTVALWEGSTEIGEIANFRSVSSTQQSFTLLAQYRFTPSAAAHTYLIKAFTGSTTGTPSFGAGSAGTAANVAAFARFTKV